MDIKLRVLKAKIRGLEAEGRSIRAHITRSSGSHKDQLWRLKRELGNYTRAHLIAYGLLRGVPYAKIESNSASMIDLKVIHDVITDTLPSWKRREWTVDRVRDLIWPPQPVVAPEPVSVPSGLTQVALEQTEGKNLCTRALEFLSRIA